MSRLKIKQPHGLCVFCGRPGLTKEHVWPQWTHEFLSKSPVPKNVRVGFTAGASIPSPMIDQRREKQGDVQTLQVRVVCREHCNGGWMSRLETAIVPVLTPLITGQTIDLREQEQKKLAGWIAKTTMMFEYADHKHVSSSSFHRRFLMESGEPPPGWRIWIAQYKGKAWEASAVRASAALTIANGDIQVIDRKLRPPMNTQSVTFGIGQLLVQIMSTTVPFLDLDVPPQFLPYTPQIWPFQNLIVWPRQHILNDADARIMINALGRMLRNDPHHLDPIVL
jgi:hypothetical protein